jgi:alkylhydroperoxidase/carboxymuconolactone decarboxylase family protein YurZ
MPGYYHDENDLKLMREMRKLAPDDFNAWVGLNNIVDRDNGAIPRKYRELIAIAVSATRSVPTAWKRTPKRRTSLERRAQKSSKLH